MTEIVMFLLVSAVVYFALHKTDDSNLQVIVLPIAVGLLYGLAAEGERAAGGAGIAVGAAVFLAYFLIMRLRAVPMPAYAHATGVETAAPTPGFPSPAGSPSTASAGPLAGTPRGPDGPYYRPGSPEKRDIAESRTAGERMFFVGRVLDRDGGPVEGAIIEIWHADGEGEYDHTEFNCRGHQFTNQNGRFVFDTVKPRGYGTRSMSLVGTIDFRSAHIHVKIRVGDRTFTSQVWFPDDGRNRLDVAYWKFKKTNVVRYDSSAEVLTCSFDFVV